MFSAASRAAAARGARDAASKSMGRVTHSIALGGPRALPAPLRGPIAIVAMLAALVCTVLAVRYAGRVAAGRLDTWIQTVVDDLLPEPGPGPFLVDFVGEPIPAIVLVGLLAAVCLALGRQRLAAVAVVGSGLTGVVTTGLKPVVGRTIHGGFLAYPSGHTAAVTALALVVMLLFVDLCGTARWAGVLLVLSGAAAAGGAMAFSQVALGAHYPTDTIGGFCAAVAVVPATAYLIDWLSRASARPATRPRPDEDSGCPQRA